MKESRELLALRYVCDNATYSKRQIAQAIGITPQSLNNFLRGAVQPRHHNFNKIKKFLDLDGLELNSGWPDAWSQDELRYFETALQSKLEQL